MLGALGLPGEQGYSLSQGHIFKHLTCLLASKAFCMVSKTTSVLLVN